MKISRLTWLTTVAAIAACVLTTSSLAQTVSPTVPGGGIQAAPKGGGLQPGPAASWPSLKRADLTAEGQGAQFGFRVRNIGTGDAPPTTTTVVCTAYTSNTPGQGTYVPCRQGAHYVLTPGMPPAGTSASGDSWKVPTPALAATSGQFAFTLNIKTTPTQKTRGLNFKVCADANNAVNELNEGNNCQSFNYTWPN